MAVECKKCKSKMVLVSGAIRFDADEEPYESGERLQMNLELDKWMHGHWCEKCEKMREIWLDEDLGTEDELKLCVG
ncbi:MAG TPA: hypothetical protein DCL81_15095 [Algoriphagus sp.]|jgi:hypothetical protein|uniref:hypothetical protein n=1 Tax=Algoriphagus sp. TaxID=1872435 RepID=UPI000C55DD5A|nr:hypothetical protein [Algoriphagus sp.]MAL13357.1 hypothetical protein [Algoriphagus sp.]MAN85575.1 hypothetical protein [Algoriphagus sp.]HAD51734.1 hypothetical protein [Algoriphagus sp.]HAH37779.1 hypothetical protein [Algoriphagus sp.]HAS58491.1 hypothetical protein [Algoriphagus sp.]|tara:strand:+ start:727 stop:954 length:228 start_codon:yes stop_codon:yes gene_type:complete